MPKVSTFTQYGTITTDDRIPFLRRTGNRYTEGLIAPPAVPQVSFKVNVVAPSLNALWIPLDGSLVVADFNPNYLSDYWNYNFTFGNRITPPVSGLYLFTFEAYGNCGVGSGSFDVGSEVLVNAYWNNGNAALMIRQTFTAPGDYTLNGSFMLRINTSTAGQFPDRSYFTVGGMLNAPAATSPAILMTLSGALIGPG